MALSGLSGGAGSGFGAPRRRAEVDDAVETDDPQRAERLAVGSPEDEPGAGRRRLAAQVEQEPGRRWAEERRAAQVEHERAVRAEQRDEVGLEHPVAGLEVADERRDDGAPGGATAPGPAGGQGAEGVQRLRHEVRLCGGARLGRG